MWATPEKALQWTGKDIPQDELNRAAFVLTPYAGRTGEEPEDAIAPVDRHWLGMATAFQALWMRGKPGLLEQRESHTSSSADGVSVQRESDSQVMLAPIAARCLRNLSWIGNRTTYQLPPADPPVSFLNEESDGLHGWKPRSIR